VARTGLFLSRDSAACITATIGPPRGGQPFQPPRTASLYIPLCLTAHAQSTTQHGINTSESVRLFRFCSPGSGPGRFRRG
jgi:hypothetical protein